MPIDNSPTTLGNVAYLECLGSCGSGDTGKKYTLSELKQSRGTIFEYICDTCFGPLDVQYDMDFAASRTAQIRERSQGYWQVLELLPANVVIVDPDTPYTPLVKFQNLSNELGIDLYGKLDCDPVNPTRTFKDRPMRVTTNVAREAGYIEMWIASTGNLATSGVYYAKKYGMKPRVLIPDSLSQSKKNAILQLMEDPSDLEELSGVYDKANKQMLSEWNELSDERQGQVVIPNASFRPYYKEGSKTNGFEISFQIQQAGIDPERPINLVYPVGSGALLCSAYKGIEELRSIGLTNNPARTWAAQPENCAPVVSALKKGRIKSGTNGDSIEQWYIDPIQNPETVAQSIRIGNPGSGYQALDVIERSGGGGWTVSERDILDWVLKLYETEGIFGQDVAGVTLAGIYQGVRNGDIKPGDLIVANITGTGYGRFEDDLERYGYEFGFAPRVDSLFQKIGLSTRC